MLEQSDPRGFFCTHCARPFLYRSTRNEHEERCKAAEPTLSNMLESRPKPTWVEGKPKCTKCEAEFPSLNDYIFHLDNLLCEYITSDGENVEKAALEQAVIIHTTDGEAWDVSLDTMDVAEILTDYDDCEKENLMISFNGREWHLNKINIVNVEVRGIRDPNYKHGYVRPKSRKRNER